MGPPVGWAGYAVLEGGMLHEYPMPIADMLINDPSGHKIIVFLMVMLVTIKDFDLWLKKML
mgnify:CR=1 FL=1